METTNINKVLYIALGISILVNIVMLGVMLFKNFGDGRQSNPKENASMTMEQWTDKAKVKVKEVVCSNLYIPESYDPVEIRVDSAFWGYLTDGACLKAAEELIELRSKYQSEKSSYDVAIDQIRTFGSSGVFRQFATSRDNAKKEMETLKPQIEKCEATIRNRDTSHDGTFIGWFVYNRYRAKTNSNNIVFEEALILFDKDLEKWNINYDMNKKSKANFYEMKKVLDEVLGINN